MQNYQKLNWKYSEPEQLEFDEWKLAEANRNINSKCPILKENAEKEIPRLTADIDERKKLINLILDNEEWQK